MIKFILDVESFNSALATMNSYSNLKKNQCNNNNSCPVINNLNETIISDNSNNIKFYYNDFIIIRFGGMGSKMEGVEGGSVVGKITKKKEKLNACGKKFFFVNVACNCTIFSFL